ncbi:MAG: cation-transporting P-type ATPase [Clostridia bacterium]|nr:cation-transporting P-type ATPase [Clostridia bacterium]
MAEKWYNLTPEQIEAKLSTDLTVGLTHRQASARLRREGRNTIYRTERPRASALVFDVLRDPCAYMLLAAAVLAWIFNENVGAPLVILLILLNSLLVLTAYIKARDLIAEAREQSIPTATVIRGGKQYLIRQDRLCRGDIIILTKGDVVPADARLIESFGLRVLEVALTGEVEKKRKDSKIIFANNLSPEKQSDMVFATSVVTEGQARAVVCETGTDTLAYLLGRTVKTEEKNEDPGILLSLKKHCSVWSLIMLVMVFVLTLFDFIIGFESRSIFNIFITGLAVATAGMCEYYLVFGYIILGCSMYSRPRKKDKASSGAVVKNIGDIDRIKDISALILPINGAFTAGRVRLKKLYFDSVLYAPDERNLQNNCAELISAALDSTSYTDNDYEKTYNRFKARDASVEEREIYTLARHSGVFDGPVYMASHILVGRRAEEEVTVTRVAVNGRIRKILRGSAEDILPICTLYRASEGVKPIKNEKNRVSSIIKDLSDEGLYAVCIATKDIDEKEAGEGFVFEGFLCFNQPRLSGAAENVKRIQDAGIKIIMTAEDSTSRSYARALGILASDDGIMTSDKLRGMTDDLFRTNISEYTLYEGLDIPQKRLLIKHLQENGETVGCFGCSFEDMILIREADVGFSSGITLARGNSLLSVGTEDEPVHISSQEEKGSGSEALKQTCDVIVSPAEGNEGGFNAITSAVARSRRALSSLYRVVRYLLISQCARLFVFLYSAMVPIDRIPFCGEDIFTPVQILVLGLVFDLGVVMAFAFKSHKGIIAKRQYRDSSLKHMLFGVFWGVCALMFPALLRLMGVNLSNEAMSTMVFFGFLLTSLVSAFECVTDRSVFRKGFISNIRGILAAVLTLGLIVLCAFTKAFDCCMLTPLQWVMTALTPLCMLTMFEIYKIVKGKKYDRDKET